MNENASIRTRLTSSSCKRCVGVVIFRFFSLFFRLLGKGKTNELAGFFIVTVAVEAIQTHNSKKKQNADINRCNIDTL